MALLRDVANTGSGQRRRTMTRKLATFAYAAALLALSPVHGAKSQTTLQGQGTVRALVIGIDDYLYVPRLRGATADARDLENTLRGIGVTDMRVMINASATRGSLLVAFQQLVDRTQPGDTIFLSLSGHGAPEPERVKGSEPDGMDAVFLLAGFDPTSRERNGEKILDKEFNHFIRIIEERGAKVVFIADTCSGGGLARDVDIRASEMSYRAVKYTPIQDNIQPVADRVDALATPSNFKASLFLAAVDKQSKVPEIRVPGVGFRGALSYAVARGLEGAADLDSDGVITASELFDYSSRVAYQMSDQRQKIVTVSGQDADPKTTVIVSSDRGIAVVPGTPAGKVETVAPTQVPKTSPPPAATKPTPEQQQAVKPTAPAKVETAKKPDPAIPAASAMRIRVAALDGRPVYFEGISTQVDYQVVQPGDNPDLIWDTSSREVVANGDVIARNVDRNDIPGLIERVAAINWLKKRVARSPQSIRVMPDDRVHQAGSRVDVEIQGLSGRSLVLFNIAGDGTVQFLYPVGNDPAQRRDPVYHLQVQVQPPFGADQIIAISSQKPLLDLKNAVKGLDGRRNPLMAADLIAKYAGADALVGSAGLYTSQ